MSTPAAVHERLRWPSLTLTPSVSDGMRVRWPMYWARYWSSEIVLRKPPFDGCGAHVRKRHAAEDGEVVPVVLEDLEVRRERIVAARPGREEHLRQEAEVVADRE